jgi:hypothetical protein
MDMTDNELLEQLFGPARQMTVADNGFSDRVMERIPNSSTRTLSRLWTLFCVTVATVLFVVLDGWQLVVNGLMMLLKTPPTQHGLLMMAVSAGVIWLLAFVELVSRERYRLI